MKLFVTGGAGFIGSAVVRQAIAAGHTVLNVDKLTYAANLENLSEIKGHPAYQFEQADICDGAKMLALIEATVVWYLSNQDWIADIAARGHAGERLGLSSAKKA